MVIEFYFFITNIIIGNLWYKLVLDCMQVRSTWEDDAADQRSDWPAADIKIFPLIGCAAAMLPVTKLLWPLCFAWF